MKAYEFSAKVTAEGKLDMPSTVADVLAPGQVVRLLVLVGEPEDSIELTRIPEVMPKRDVTDESRLQKKNQKSDISLNELMNLLEELGPISDEDARLMLEAIEEEFERVDLNDWR